MELKGFQKKALRGLAHNLKPVVIIGQKGLTPAVVASVNEALNIHELIKVKFIEFKEKEDKTRIAGEIESVCNAGLAGIIGHIAIFYRPHPEPEERRIRLPQKKDDA